MDYTMKKQLLCYAMVLFLCVTAIISCSDKKEQASGKGFIDQVTDDTAQEIINRINVPLAKARSVNTTLKNRVDTINDAIKEP